MYAEPVVARQAQRRERPKEWYPGALSGCACGGCTECEECEKAATETCGCGTCGTEGIVSAAAAATGSRARKLETAEAWQGFEARSAAIGASDGAFASRVGPRAGLALWMGGDAEAPVFASAMGLGAAEYALLGGCACGYYCRICGAHPTWPMCAYYLDKLCGCDSDTTDTETTDTSGGGGGSGEPDCDGEDGCSNECLLDIEAHLSFVCPYGFSFTAYVFEWLPGDCRCCYNYECLDGSAAADGQCLTRTSCDADDSCC